ncbi:hypothetical protein WJX81_001903 [Elliptochloris bilobata]|uniref:lipoyl(octanoyl) transferase n=1 Tax=Elliptochloris bilobata TaxID=381761 RepID=A0AAW1SJQ3_9CHLO
MHASLRTCAASCESAGGDRARVLVFDYSDRLVPYEQAWHRQKELVAAVLAAADAEAPIVDMPQQRPPPAGALLLLQHAPVYTLGAGSSLEHLSFDADAPPLPLHRTERGGEVTYHGPGQLVAYPVLDLRRFRSDLHWYLRALEEVVIRALREVSGLEGVRRAGLTGVWLPGGKVAAIGVRARRWVAYHGLALNVAPDLAPFAAIG